MTEINELRQDLKDVVKEMKEGHKTQMEILAELRIVKPKVDSLEVDLEKAQTKFETELQRMKDKYDADLEKLKIFMWKCLGIGGAMTFLGAPALAGLILMLAAK